MEFVSRSFFGVRLALWLIAPLLIIACRDASVSAPTESGAALRRSAALQAIRVNPARRQSIDEVFAEIEVQAPGFAGFTLEGGRVIVRATSEADAERLTEVVHARLQGSPLLRDGTVAIRRVSFSFLQLSEWRDLLTGFPAAGLVSSDVDEATNRVSIHVVTEGHAEMVRTWLEARGVPSRAVSVSVRSRTVPATTLRDYVRPVIGGLAIEQGALACTMGFWVRLAEAGDYFVTNSHCTTTRYGLDGNFYERQPTWYPDATFGQIGYEYRDPNLYWDYPNCDDFTYCRYSDASIFRYTIANFDRSLIGRTDTLSIVPGTLGGVTLSQPYFDVTGEVPFSNLVVGQGLNKVGSTTGWSAGAISATCVREYQISPVNHYLDCQYEASLTVGSGDSGSPIFQYYGGATGYSVFLAGMIWGRSDSLYTIQLPTGTATIGSIAVFSPLPLMRMDLGNFYVTP